MANYQNLQQLSSALPPDLRLDPNATPEEIASGINRLLEAINRRFDAYDQQHKAHAGHAGVVRLNNHLDMNGYRLINAGAAVGKKDLVTKQQSEATAGAMSTLFQLAQSGNDTGLDIGDLGGGEDAVEPQPAGQVRNITLYWHNAKAGWWLRFKRPGKYHATVKAYDLAFFNSTNFLDLTTGGIAADEATATKRITDNEYKVKVNKLNLDAAFSTGVDVKITPISLISGAYIRGTPATYGSLVAPGNDFVNPNDGVNVIDIGINLNSPQQMLLNGDMLFNDGAVGTVNGYRRYTVDPATDSAITNSSANGVYWDDPNHSLIWKDVATRWFQGMKKRLKKGQFYSIGLLLKTDGSFGSGTIVVSVVNSDDSSVTTTTFAIDLVDLTSSFKLFGGTIQLDTSSVYTTNKFLKFTTATTLSATNNIIIDAIMMVRGKVVYAFTPRSNQYEGNSTAPGSTEDITLGTINNVPAPDLGNPTHDYTQSGFDPTGGEVHIGTY